MDELLIPSATGSGGLLFYNRSPSERTLPFETFWVRVWDQNLVAATRVYAGYVPSHPGSLFAAMKSQWSGWSRTITWCALEGELSLSCTHDQLGHIAIEVEMQSSSWDDTWQVKATVITEAGQLESLARKAVSFFGCEA